MAEENSPILECLEQVLAEDICSSITIPPQDNSTVNINGYRTFALARVEKHGVQYYTRLIGPRRSGVLTSMTSANGLVTVPEDKERVGKGDMVQVMI